MSILAMILLIIPFLVSISCSVTNSTDMIDVKLLPEVNGDIFYYFGYGSNMLTKRIHIQNPTAVKIGAGVLKNYRLDFNDFSGNWDGAPATVVPHVNKTVQGTVWEIDLSNLDDIDDQEGVHEGMYKAESVPITLLASGKEIIARVYLLTDQPKTDYAALLPAEIPYERQPSKTYMQCLVKGAIESGIEPWYVEWLKSLKHNGVIAPKMSNLLDLENVKLNS